MEIRHAEFISSHTDMRKYPVDDKPEFAFIGRSNVGKSSLINMLTKRKNLAKTSVRPGKTQTINHYLIDNKWYLVDLPGYGYASVAKATKKGWGKMIEEYVLRRENLYCLFILIDSRLSPQPIDLNFIHLVGNAGIPICLVLTKTDKITKVELQKNMERFEKKLKETWAELPVIFTTSSLKKKGRDEILHFIESAMAG
ncbi:MAG TPA: ribosome biogenesis GTP-binding protein YihA/YsxC [Cyclobacteriaceae bacterium]|nr:ribosome biogenesis GTP-binding protein YihA/YsxC [Cyclobacteriaceae bacterium]